MAEGKHAPKRPHTHLSSPRDIATPLVALIVGDVPGSLVMLGL